MGEPAKASVQLRQFGGMVTHTDRTDLELGEAEEQVNITANRIAELTTRGGYREVTFED